MSEFLHTAFPRSRARILVRTRPVLSNDKLIVCPDLTNTRLVRNVLGDTAGCITAEELKFVLTHLPGKVGCIARHSLLYPNQVTYKEIEEMIRIVDKNGDGKVSYSEFRVGWQLGSALVFTVLSRRWIVMCPQVMMGAKPLALTSFLPPGASSAPPHPLNKY